MSHVIKLNLFSTVTFYLRSQNSLYTIYDFIQYFQHFKHNLLIHFFVYFFPILFTVWLGERWDNEVVKLLKTHKYLDLAPMTVQCILSENLTFLLVWIPSCCQYSLFLKAACVFVLNSLLCKYPTRLVTAMFSVCWVPVIDARGFCF